MSELSFILPREEPERRYRPTVNLDAGKGFVASHEISFKGDCINFKIKSGTSWHNFFDTGARVANQVGNKPYEFDQILLDLFRPKRPGQPCCCAYEEVFSIKRPTRETEGTAEYQKRIGANNATIAQVMAAHVCYYNLTEEDFFGGHSIRTSGGDILLSFDGAKRNGVGLFVPAEAQDVGQSTWPWAAQLVLPERLY
jgi:hypothetical protein